MLYRWLRGYKTIHFNQHLFFYQNLFCLKLQFTIHNTVWLKNHIYLILSFVKSYVSIFWHISKNKTNLKLSYFEFFFFQFVHRTSYSLTKLHYVRVNYNKIQYIIGILLKCKYSWLWVPGIISKYSLIIINRKIDVLYESCLARVWRV